MSCKGNRVDKVLEDESTPTWRLKVMDNVDVVGVRGARYALRSW